MARLRAVSPACVQNGRPVIPTPDDHFTTGPHYRVKVSGSGRGGGAGGCPTIRAGIVLPAGVQKVRAIRSSTPDDHFTAGPHCCVNASTTGRVGSADSCPTIRAGIVSRACVHIHAVISAPDDHFAATPDRWRFSSG